ncbi:MAG: hypothetical protein U1D35_01305 [Paracoccaceae bacterium]|nr:hypothetical protein [Paracoccaceae bacterium]
MVEPRACRIKADRTVPGTMARVDDFQTFQSVAGFQDQGCLFRNNQNIKALEKLYIITINQYFTDRRQLAKRAVDHGGYRRQPDFNQADAPSDRSAGQTANLIAQPVVRRDDHDVIVKIHLGKRQRDRQAVGDLMDLIMVEQKSDPPSPGRVPVGRDPA